LVFVLLVFGDVVDVVVLCVGFVVVLDIEV
jgi:hypothetical protein